MSIGIQGWKLHLAATEGSASELLSIAVPLLIESITPFKVLSSPSVLKQSMSKLWDRRATGKFITIYPSSTKEFETLSERLYRATTHLSGPYILTDHPYKDSSVVFYRYGAHLGLTRLAPDGTKRHFIQAPNGELCADLRVPYYYQPDWIHNPFVATPINDEHTAPENDEHTAPEMVELKGSRYLVDGALRYSAFGGIYTGIDTITNTPVVIREARPHADLARKNIYKESLILQTLAGLDRAPCYIDHFIEAGHVYLVQEKLEGSSLWGYAGGFLVASAEQRTPRDLRDLIVSTFGDIVTGTSELHSRGVIIRDLTKLNIIVGDDQRARFIDFELAYNSASDADWVSGGTPGYISPSQELSEAPTVEDDYFALGAILLEMICFTAPALAHARSAALRACAFSISECGLPQSLLTLVSDLTEPEPKTRPTPHIIQQRLLHIMEEPLGAPTDPLILGRLSDPMYLQDTIGLKQDLQHEINGIVRFIRSHTTPSRSDRLWPSVREMYETNPLSIRFGACGILEFLRCTSSSSEDESLLEWVTSKASLATCPPSFYSGLSGIAWIFFKYGQIDQALAFLRQTCTKEYGDIPPGLQDGIAGIALTALSIGTLTQNEWACQYAEDVGTYLISTSKTADDGSLYWMSGDSVPLGYGAGASGIALLFLHLYNQRGNTLFLSTARAALSFDVSKLVSLGCRLYLAENLNSDNNQVSPHVRYGSAGLLSVLCRYRYMVGGEEFDNYLGPLLIAVASRQTNKLWQDWGLAGLGDSLLDAAHFLGNDNAYHGALHTAAKLLQFSSCKTDNEKGYLGNELLFFSCDYGLGASGIGSFYNRVLDPSMPRLGFFDELLKSDHTRTSLHIGEV